MNDVIIRNSLLVLIFISSLVMDSYLWRKHRLPAWLLKIDAKLNRQYFTNMFFRIELPEKLFFIELHITAIIIRKPKCMADLWHLFKTILVGSVITLVTLPLFYINFLLALLIWIVTAILWNIVWFVLFDYKERNN